MRTLRGRLSVLVLAGSLLVACGDDTTEQPEGADEDVVVVTAVNYAFEDVPGTVSVGTRLDLRNESEDELHELVAVRIRDDESRSVEELVALPEAEAGAALVPGPPAMVLLAMPGEDTAMAAVGDGTLTEAGRYAIVCFIPTGVDPQEFMDAAAAAGPDAEGPPDVGGGPPHIVHGMFAELTVE